MKKLVENVLSRRQKVLSQHFYKRTWKKGTFKAEKSIFPFFLTPLISGIKVKVLEAEKVENSKSVADIAYYETLINRKKNDVAAVGQLGILSVLKKRKTESWPHTSLL